MNDRAFQTLTRSVVLLAALAALLSLGACFPKC